MMKYSFCRTYGYLKFIVILIAISGYLCVQSYAQEIKDLQLPKNAKLVGEYDDGRGHIIREVQYTQGNMLVTEQLILPKIYTGIGVRRPINPDTMKRDSTVIFINKSLYSVQVYYRHKIVRAYKAVFGPDPKRNKCMEGDRCTPEGWFTISSKNPRSKYNKFLQISYPNDSSYKRFNYLKALGKIPENARIGGSIGIHGIWAGGDNMIELGVGWTDGCIALKNEDVEELYSMIGVGTRVFIKK